MPASVGWSVKLSFTDSALAESSDASKTVIIVSLIGGIVNEVLCKHITAA